MHFGTNLSLEPAHSQDLMHTHGRRPSRGPSPALRYNEHPHLVTTPLSPPAPSLDRLPPGLHRKETNPPLRRHPVKPLYDIPILILIGTNLTSVLRYHHAFVREDQAFEPRFVLAAVDLAKTQVHAQLAENKRQGEERDLPPSVEHPPVDDNFPTYPQKNKRASFNVPSPFQRSKPRPTSKRSPMSNSYNVQAPSNVASITPVPTVHPVP
ncbi:hypothetical protein F5H01DRAFT_327565 [Linnemannia elongata]|nr:hypothetical protein F5H01DRAFT_327565 [Linnemannia elongata]